MLSRINLFFEKKPITSFVLLAVLLVSLQGISSFCSKKNCPAFSDKNFDAWFPYQNGQVVYYKTTDGDVDSLYIYSVTKSPVSSSGGYGRACVVSASIQAENSDSLGANIFLNYSLGSGGSNYLLFNANQLFFTGTNITDSGIVLNSNNSVQSTFSSSLILNSNIYPNVQVIMEDTTGVQPGVFKIWLAKNTGLLAYQQYPSLKIFVKQ